MPSRVLVLASGSPRRRELLGRFGRPFDVRPANIDESPRPGETAAGLVRRLAVDKASAGLEKAAESDVVVLAADTLVALDDDVLAKPVDADDARRMLSALSGRTHRVLTGVAVAWRRGDGPENETLLGPATNLTVEVVTTEVTFVELTAADIDRYAASGAPLDKAGAYGIQEVGDPFVSSIDGPFDNVVGLPLTAVRRLLTDAGIDLAGS